MKRKELLAMPQVTAPLEMITVAEADQPYIDKTYCRPMTQISSQSLSEMYRVTRDIESLLFPAGGAYYRGCAASV